MEDKKNILKSLVSVPYTEFIKAFPKKAGSSPGTVVYTGKKRKHKAGIHLIQFSKEQLSHQSIVKADELKNIHSNSNVVWVNLDGVHNEKLIKNIGEVFDLHSLWQEDITNVNSRPSYEELNGKIFLSLKMLYIKEGTLHFENVSIVIGSNFVLSFQELPADVFEPIRKRLEMKDSKIREYGTDYLAYSLVDAIIDHYYYVLEYTGDRLEALEDELQISSDKHLLFAIQDQKREIIKLRRSIYPLREVVGKFEKSDSELIKDTTHKYLRDLYDHTIQVIE
ncbi:MAG: magnesium and cobalt transport protein CorA, partial [Bacteroidia bacterium]|nr:magnesium and cobalt transport protein CorA [Bacteroidia bacterium]